MTGTYVVAPPANPDVDKVDSMPTDLLGREYETFPAPEPLQQHGPARVIAMCNQKGGVGKTTSSINIAGALAQYGRRVLIVDFDPQGAATVGLGINANAVSATKLATARTISATGDATGPASFDGSANAAIALTLANSGVTAGTYGKVTVDAKGRVTAGLAMVAADIPSLDWSKITTGKPTTLAGYGITDALGINANAVSASKWAAARTITLAGDATGSVSIDGSGNATLTVAVVDNSHTHTTATITDLRPQNEGAIGSTLALRDSAADIHARLLRATYQDQSDMNGALVFRANNSTDNYTRYCNNPTAVRTWLNKHKTAWNMECRAYIEDPNNPMTEYQIPGKHAVITYLATDGHFRISSSNGAGVDAGERLRIDTGGNLYAAGGVHDMGQRVYSPNNPPHNSHNHTAAQGNSDIVAGSYGQVGTYALASNVTGVTKTIGTTVAGSSLVPASAGDRNQDGTTLPGTWKCLGYSYGTGGNFDARITLWIRIA